MHPLHQPGEGILCALNRRLLSILFQSLSTVCLLCSCTSLQQTFEGHKINYKTANKLPPLDVPPDLTALPADDRYGIPDVGPRKAVTASDLAAQQNLPTQRVATETVLPTVTDVVLERSGSQRWLVVNKTPEELWPVLKEFWLQAGFTLKVDTPSVGVMQTDWAESRPAVPHSGIRALIDRAFDSIRSNGQLDLYRTRLERTATGTEIYISHRGLEEVYTSAAQDSTVWQPRAADPELEAEFLNRLMVTLGAAQVQTAGANNKNINGAGNGADNGAGNPMVTISSKATLKTDQQGSKVVVTEPFDRTWRRVGLALDRVGFAVEDRDRSKGIYFVRYIDPELDRSAAQKKNDKGFFAGLFDKSSSADKKLKSQPKYRIVVTPAMQGSEVSVQNNDGNLEQGEVGKRILSLLQEELQ